MSGIPQSITGEVRRSCFHPEQDATIWPLAKAEFDLASAEAGEPVELKRRGRRLLGMEGPSHFLMNAPLTCRVLCDLERGFEESTDTRAGKHPVGVLAFRAHSRSMDAAELRALVQRKPQDRGFANESLTAVVAGPRKKDVIIVAGAPLIQRATPAIPYTVF
jgi:hypothetical protein